MITFDVAGPFGTKGSARLVETPKTGRLYMKPSSKFLPRWVSDVRWAAHKARVPKIPKGIGVHLEVTYEFTPPRSRCPRRSPCIKPDVDKLARALLDALTGLAYVDDEQVTRLVVVKVYGAADVAHVSIGQENING